MCCFIHFNNIEEGINKWEIKSKNIFQVFLVPYWITLTVRIVIQFCKSNIFFTEPPTARSDATEYVKLLFTVSLDQKPETNPYVCFLTVVTGGSSTAQFLQMCPERITEFGPCPNNNLKLRIKIKSVSDATEHVWFLDQIHYTKKYILVI